MNKQFQTFLEWVAMSIALISLFYFTKSSNLFILEKSKTIEGRVLSLIGILLVSFFTLGIHELGHLITGLVQGFKFQLFVVGPLGIKRDNDKIKVYLNTNMAYYGGIAATSPKGDAPDNAKKFARVILAGPITSLLFGIICLVIATIPALPTLLFFSGGLISIALFFATTIPSKTGLFFTDRKRFQRLITPGKDQEVEMAMLRISGVQSRDNSYKNLNEKDIHLLVSDSYPFIRFFGLFCLLCHHIETEKEIPSHVKITYDELAKKMSKNVVNTFEKEMNQIKQNTIKA